MKRVVKRVAAVAGIVLGVLIVTAGLAYAFGTMQPPTAEVRAAYEQRVEAGAAPPAASRFGIPIPGCVCHSDDPVLQVEHSTRYIRECAGCHQR